MRHVFFAATKSKLPTPDLERLCGHPCHFHRHIRHQLNVLDVLGEAVVALGGAMTDDDGQ